MTLFLLGLIVFFLPHLFTAFLRGAREALMRRIGEGAYKGLYSVVSAIGLALIIVGWPAAGDAFPTPLYVANFALVHVVYVLTLAALVLLAAAYLPAGKIAAAAKHPMLLGVKLWAFAHLLVNGEVRSLILFGSFLAYGVVDRIAVKVRGAPTRAAGPWTNDLVAVLVGGAAWGGVFLFLHPSIAGVPVPGAAQIRALIGL
ncbi:MAG: NnrU family protein [Parvularculaceae bacterium]|nr:NnrU family protein [Parvularculaceae bacterium]